MASKKPSEKDKKQAAKEKKAALLAKLEAQKAREAQMEELRERVRKLLQRNVPPQPLEIVTTALPKLQQNPWQLILDNSTTTKFLPALLKVLQDAKVLKEQTDDVNSIEKDVKEQPTVEKQSTEGDGAQPSGEGKDKEEAKDAAPTVGEAAQEPPADPRTHYKEQLDAIFSGIKDLADFAIGQPAFFITDNATLNILVQILHELVDNESGFSHILAILSPTIKHQKVTQQLADAKIIDPLMEFVEKHMPELPADDSVEEALPGNPPKSEESLPEASEVKILKHNYSMDTFRTVMNVIKMLSVSANLREKFKEAEGPYLRLRHLSMGTASGFSPSQQEFAQRCLKYFIEDGEQERALGKDLPPSEKNKAMLDYWKGHVHQLFCVPAAADAKNPSAAAKARTRTRKTHQYGFADQAALDAINRNGRRRKIKKH